MKIKEYKSVLTDNGVALKECGFHVADASIELGQNRKTICGLFEKLDLLSVPYWVQNTVLCWSEDWRQYKTGCIISAFDKFRNNPDFEIDFSGVSSL